MDEMIGTSKQAIFNRVVTHLFNQAKPARGEWPTYSVTDGCMYRTDDGLSCAIGCLIPESVYEKSMEGHGVKEIIDLFPDLYKYLGTDTDLLDRLQLAHDEGAWDDEEHMKDTLVEIAENFDLNDSILQDLHFSVR